MICPGYQAPQFFIYTEQIAPLIYYSHFSAFILLAVAIFVHYKSRTIPSKVLLYLGYAFFVWTILNLITWTNNSSDIIMFVWSFLPFAYSVVVILSLYLFYVFLDGKDIPIRKKLVFLMILFPAFLLTPTSYNLKGFDLDICGAAGLEGDYAIYYKLFLGIGVFLWILLLAFHKYRKAALELKKQVILFTVGIELFLLSLLVGEFIPSYLADGDFSLNQYSFFAMTFFVCVLGYLIVRFKTFNIKLLATQALVVAISVLVGSQFLFTQNNANRMLIGVTLALSLGTGIVLVRSVKREIEQREQIEELAGRLKSVNRIMSHDIKNVLGKNKDMFGMLLEDSLGPLPAQARPFLERLQHDTKQLIRSVVSILESGQELILNKARFDFKEAVLGMIKDVEYSVHERGLTIHTNFDEAEDYMIMGDRIQIDSRVLRNLIENAINYTTEGSVEISLTKKGSATILFSVKDTGVGITDEDKKNLFNEGGHGKDSIKINVHSTGYGLFSAKKIVDAHNGKIWVESEVGKGSTFFVELPVGEK